MSSNDPVGYNKTEAIWWRIKSTDRFHRAVYDKVISLTEPGEGSEWLDLGCGAGVLLEKILKTGASAAGLDASLEMLDEARDIAPDATLIHGRSYAPPTDNSYTHISLIFPSIFASREDDEQIIGDRVSIVRKILLGYGFANEQTISRYDSVFEAAKSRGDNNYMAARAALDVTLKGSYVTSDEFFVLARQYIGYSQIFERAYEILSPGGLFVFVNYLTDYIIPTQGSLEGDCHRYFGSPSGENPYEIKALHFLPMPELGNDITELEKLRTGTGYDLDEPHIGATITIIQKPGALTSAPSQFSCTTCTGQAQQQSS